MQNRAKLCTGITACLVLVLSIIALVLVFMVKQRDIRSNDVVNDMEKSFMSKGIQKITSTTANSCPSGTEPMFNFNFPGTDTICSCTNDETGKKKLVSIYKSGCFFISGYTCKKTKIPPAQMHKFKGKLLCVVRSDFSYEGYESVPKNGACKSLNSRVCGQSQEKKLCLPSTVQCPVNSVVITKGHLKTEDIVSGGYQTIELEDDYKLYFSNKKTGNHIITDFKTSYEGPCISPDETKVPADYEASGLDGNYFYVEECEDNMGTSSAIDPRWKKEAEVSRLSIFNDNGYFQDYESTSNINMKSLNAPGHYIYSRGYSDWDRQCMSNPHQSIGENFKQLKSVQEDESKAGLSTAAIVLLFVAIISAIIWLIYTFTKNATGAVVLCCCIWLCLLLLATIVILSLLFTRSIRDYPDNSENWMKEGCGDSTSQGLLQKIVDNKSSFVKYAAWALGLTILAWLLLCCLPCCFAERSPNFENDVMRANERSNYTELVEDDFNNQQNFNPNAGYQSYPDVNNDIVVFKKTQGAPKVETTYVVDPELVEKPFVEPERQVETNYVPPAPVTTTTYRVPDPVPTTTTTYVTPAPVTTTTYVTPAPVTTTYAAPERRVTTNYVTSDPVTTTTYAAPERRVTEYTEPERRVTRTYVTQDQPTTTTRFVNQPVTVTDNLTSNIQPTTTVRYVDGNPTYTGGTIGSGIRTIDDQGRIVTRYE